MSTVATGAHADGAKLTYTRGSGAEACPDEPALREAVAQKVGRDPFDGEDVFVDVHIERHTDELTGEVEVREGGVVRGKRSLSSTSSSCDELASALVVTISVALDPARFGVPPRRTAPPPTASPADRPFFDEARPSAPPSNQKQERGFSWDVGAGAGGAFGVAPATAAAFFLSFGARWERASIELEGRTHLRASESVFGGSVSASSSLAALVPCFHVGPAALCAIGAAGVLRGEGKGVDIPSTDSSFAAAAGARLAVELSLLPALGIRAGVDGMTTIHGTRLTLAGREAWATPPLWASSWAGAVVHFR
ncbi:MAG: hypothetical protein K0S65_2889 [Labilithrix sp.]|nr:hypothetical protein [Labilithrix sp.]